MGFLAIDYAIHNDRRPKHLVVTGRTQSKLDMAKRLYPVEEAAKIWRDPDLCSDG